MKTVHIKKLFVGSTQVVDDPGIIDAFIKRLIAFGGHYHLQVTEFPDGHYLVHNSPVPFLALRKMWKSQSGLFFDVFMTMCPDAHVSVELIDGTEYVGNRYPASFTMDTQHAFIDYDKYHHVLEVFMLKRKAYETLEELEDRRDDAELVHRVNLVDYHPVSLEMTIDNENVIYTSEDAILA